MRNHTFIQHVNIVSHGWTQTTLSLETFHIFFFLTISCLFPVPADVFIISLWQKIIIFITCGRGLFPFFFHHQESFFFLKLKSSCCGKSGIIFTRIVNRKYLKSCSNLFVCCFVSLDRFYFPYMSSCTYYNTHIFRNVF